jgi:transposase InsO family protein
MIRKGKFEKDAEVKPFLNVSEELSISKSGLILRNSLIVVPKLLQEKVLALAHEGHQGIDKTKRLLRDRVWFPGLDLAVERLVRDCGACQLVSGGNYPEPIRSTEFPKRPWENLAMDFFGPIGNGHKLMVIMDEHSRFPVVIEVPSESAAVVLPHLESLFSLMGIPKKLKSDNGPPFNGEEFRDWCKQFGIQHVPIMPKWPAANGMCEVFNKNLKKIIQISKSSNLNWRSELNTFLRNYRSTPHSSTGVSPASLVYISSNLSRVPCLETPLKGLAARRIKQACKSDKKSKERVKQYADKRRKAKFHQFKVGQRVLLQKFINQKVYDKSESRFERCSYKIEAIKGAMVTIVDEFGYRLTRNAAFLKLDKRSAGVSRRDDSWDVESIGVGDNNFERAEENVVVHQGGGQPEQGEIVEERVIQREEQVQQRVSTRQRRRPEFYQAGFN